VICWRTAVGRIATQKRKRSIMSTITASSAAQEYGGLVGPQTGLLRRALDKMLEARHREVQRRIASYLQGLDDDRLARLGFSEAEIALIRAGTPISTVLGQRRAPQTD
jgi:hypothetical protein